MKLSISNIAWQSNDETMYRLLQSLGFSGLEIAPTRLVTENPYDHLAKAKTQADFIKDTYGLKIPSMQSIWFGQTALLFESENTQEMYLAYTEKAMAFANAVGCSNLVFGNPKQRNLPNNGIDPTVFFKKLANVAASKNVVIGLEANPQIYGTNFLNTTKEVLDFIKSVNHPSLKLNLDVGTMIANEESIEVIERDVELISHVHISEPYLAPIVKRTLHRDLINCLKRAHYPHYISIEMKTPDQPKLVNEALHYIKEIVV